MNSGDGLLRRSLWFAAARGDVGMTEWLLAHGAVVDAPTFSGQTALGVATALGHKAVAQRMMDQAQALSVGGDNPGSAEARNRWRERVALLEAAHFLNPERATLEAAMMVERWHPMLSAMLGTSERSVVDFHSDMQRYAAWNRFVKAHGYGPLRSVYSDEPKRLERWPWPLVIGNGQPSAPKMELPRAELARRLIAEISQLNQCVPADLPPRSREERVATLSLEYAGLMARAAKAEEGNLNLSLVGSVGALGFIPDPSLRYRTAALMLRGSAHPLREHETHRSLHCSELLAWAEDAGLADEALAVLRDSRTALEKAKPDAIAEQAARQGANLSTWKVAQSRMPERMAAELDKTKGKPGWLNVAPEVRELTGYYRSGTVVAMSWYRGKMYLVVTGTRIDGTYNTTVWEHDLEKGTSTLLPGMAFSLPQDKIEITGHDTGLWMWTSLNGIWKRDWGTGEVTHHESKSGLPTDQVFCVTDLGGTLYFGGGKRNDGALFSWNPATRGWRVLHRPGRRSESACASRRWARSCSCRHSQLTRQ